MKKFIISTVAMITVALVSGSVVSVAIDFATAKTVSASPGVYYIQADRQFVHADGGGQSWVVITADRQPDHKPTNYYATNTDSGRQLISFVEK